MQADSILEEMTIRLSTLVDKFKEAISDTDDDSVTSNMLQDMTQKLEKYHWMLRRQTEKRETASKEAAARVLASFIRV
jgi:DNA-binding ferritin-like protein